jgi:hypothetical protein
VLFFWRERHSAAELKDFPVEQAGDDTGLSEYKWYIRVMGSMLLILNLTMYSNSQVCASPAGPICLPEGFDNPLVFIWGT